MISPPVKSRYLRLRAEGWNRKKAAAEVGISYSSAIRIETGSPLGGDSYKQRVSELAVPEVVPRDKLCDEAARALEDFAYFRKRYFGRVTPPWQVQAAEKAVELLGTPDKEYVVANEPPGAGKSTLFSHDLPIWMICRDRRMRIFYGSRTQRLAARYSGRIGASLTRTRVFNPPPEMIAKGLAVPAEACLVKDYGRFKPINATLWRREEFTVLTDEDESSDDKEPTVSAFGMETEFIGERAPLVIWDDLVDNRLLRNLERIEEQRKWWDAEAEPRLEPGGVLWLVGQRMGASDLYRYCVDKEGETDNSSKYHHIVFPAHDETRCKGDPAHKFEGGDHGRDAPAWDGTDEGGCLLDPKRLPWGGAGGLAALAKGDAYRVQYQQEDVDPDDVLVQMLWVKGGLGPDGVQYPGCWDPDRSVAQIPRGLSLPWYSVVGADPSPTKFWAIGWWLIHPASNQQFLLDLIRQGMDAPDFLDWNANEATFHGVMEEWQERSVALGASISHWIVEANAAQRFILQYDHFRRWQTKWGVDVIPHQTHLNKGDPDYGIQMLKNIWKHGQVRLPGQYRDGSRTASMKLVDEVTRYPKSATDDCMMQQWFVNYNLENIILGDAELPEQAELWRPAAMKEPVAA